MTQPTANPPNPKFRMFATSAPGLENITANELMQLHAARVEPVPGGANFEGDLNTLYRANLRLRTAGRVLVRIAEFKERHLAGLQKKTARLPWNHFMSPNTPFNVTATCNKSIIYHSGAAAQRVAQGIKKNLQLNHTSKFNDRVPLSHEDHISVYVRLDNNNCTISVDSSGANLHKRGYREETAKAPLRETLAAAALVFCGWNGCSPLVDPMCGSGTIPIEGALFASKTAPGIHRKFSFFHWPIHNANRFSQEKQRVIQYAVPLAAPIIASDRNPNAVAISYRNARRANLENTIQFVERPLSSLELPHDPGMIICNPPYGRRIGEERELRSLYESLGHIIKKNPKWKLCLITSNNTLAMMTGLEFQNVSPPFPHGGIRIKIYCT